MSVMDTTSARMRFSGPGSRELDAAGITDAALRASYARCRTLNAAHGKTYYLAALLLPTAKRPFVHALYGFARYADDIVDDHSRPHRRRTRRRARHLERGLPRRSRVGRDQRPGRPRRA